MDKSKYYYDYTRNMSYEQAQEHCGKPTCEKEICICIKQNNVLKEKAKPIFLEKNEMRRFLDIDKNCSYNDCPHYKFKK